MLIDFNTLKKYNITPHGVLHVGMHKAEEYRIYKKAGVDKIIFIEANINLVNSCKIVDKNCHIIHAAISDKMEEVEFNITNNGESSSILPLGEHAIMYPQIHYIDKIKMITETLDKILKRFDIHSFNFNVLNFDIQGAELKAMKGLSDWSNVDAVFTEINFIEMYKGCSLISEIDEFLNEKKFDRVETVDTGSGWGDALYIKRKEQF
jgi:FkbM family methyltransferase